jgi:carbonic anhydrase
VNLTDFVEAELAPIEIDYTSEATEIVNNGHTIQVRFAPGSRIRVSGRQFQLEEVHFRTPSEHLIDGKSFAMEAQLMHRDAEGNQAVIALLYDEGAANRAIGRLWAKLPEEPGDRLPVTAGLKAEDLLPNDRDYYRYNGSLTTPPCSEGVWWLVLKQPLSASRWQVATYAELMHHNSRRAQPLNARPVLK